LKSHAQKTTEIRQLIEELINQQLKFDN